MTKYPEFAALSRVIRIYQSFHFLGLCVDHLVLTSRPFQFLWELFFMFTYPAIQKAEKPDSVVRKLNRFRDCNLHRAMNCRPSFWPIRITFCLSTKKTIRVASMSGIMNIPEILTLKFKGFQPYLYVVSLPCRTK